MHFSLAQARAYRGINQEDFARALGVSVPTLIKYEANTSTMRVITAHEAARLLGFSFDGTDFISAESEATK